ncbi:MAG TPA: OmpA family protein [Allosphingosinicella sp.]|nr:OmpA family protein [Allosphingosinicella sp.]
MKGSATAAALLLALIAGSACAPSPPAAAPPPPPPIPVIGPPSPSLLFFEFGEVSLTERHRLVLSHPLNLWRNGMARAFLIEGHDDTAGPDEESIEASRRRAWAVHDHLVTAGIPAAAIAVRYHGEDRPLVATEDDVREPQNRRVEIHFARTAEELRR